MRRRSSRWSPSSRTASATTRRSSSRWGRDGAGSTDRVLGCLISTGRAIVPSAGWADRELTAFRPSAFPSSLRPNDDRARPPHPPPLPRDLPPGRVVGAAARGLRHPRELRGIRHLVRLPERALHLGAVPLAVLQPRAVRRFAPCLVRAQARLVARMAAVQPGAHHPAVPGALPLHPLLLPGL